MQTSPLVGVELLLPYVLSLAIFVGVTAACIYFFRQRLELWLSSIDPRGEAAGGFVRLVVLLCVAVLGTLAFIEVVAGVMGLLGQPLAPWMTMLALLCGISLTVVAGSSLIGPQRRWPATLAVIAVTALLSVAGVLLAGHFYDVSWDGQCYHEPAIVSIARGWDFARDPQGRTVQIGPWRPESHPDRPFNRNVVHSSIENPSVGNHKWWTPGTMWDFAITHYAKGGWIRSAAIYQLTGRLQDGKSLNLVLFCLELLVWVAAVLAFFPKRWGTALLVGVLTATNPITVIQLFSNKNDGQLGSLLAILVGLLGIYLAGYVQWPLVAALCFAFLMLCTIKFTGLVYSCLILLAFAAALLIKRAPRQQIVLPGVSLAITFMLTVLVVAYNPYVQNTIDHGSPFYPLIGKGSVDIVSNQWPVNFDGTNRFTRLALSVFSQTSDEAVMAGDTTHLKVPFVIYPSEIRPYLGFDVRVAGMGPWFGGALLLTALLLVLLAFAWRRVLNPVLAGGLLLVCVLLMTVFANSESWWARYAPQLWMVPVITAGLALLTIDSKRLKVLAWMLVFVLAFNTALVCAINFSNVVHGNHEMSAALDKAQRLPGKVAIEQGDFGVSWVKLEERGINWELARKGASYRNGVKIPYSTATLYPLVY